MKKTLLLAAAALVSAVQGLGQGYQGNLDGVSCQNISGWATGQYLFPAYVDIYDGSTIVQPNVPANIYRGDLGNNWGFSIAPPAALLDHRLHQVYAKFSGTQVNVGSTPKAIQCASGSQGYTYYSQSTFGDPGNWTSNGTVSTAGNLFSSSSEGSWISITGVPDGTSNYEVKTILSLKQSGGTYIQYLHATGNAMTGFGTAIQVELSDPQFSGGGCTAALIVSDIGGPIPGTDGQWTVPCADGMEMRTVIVPPSGGVSWLGIMVGGTEYWAVSNITSGQPGIGALGTPSGNGLTYAALGLRDAVAPGQVDAGTVKTYLTTNEATLAWNGVADDPNGVGLWYYLIVRDNAVIGDSYSADYTDTTVAVGSTHTYQIGAEDWHGNFSWSNPFSITMPAAGYADPRRVGVRPTGNYWGGMGEQIDTLSGNVNYSVTLLSAMGRGGWSVPFGLSYNSQNWRMEQGYSWKMGADVGYGFGWQLMAGSIRPYWNGWAIDHFVFTDATGAEYRLDQQNGTVWSSKQSIYVWYDYATSLLHFKDGSFWYMGCISSGAEQDAGAMYPTLMEDSNGNQISISYLPGVGPYATNGAGANPINSSARINQILDARAIALMAGIQAKAYSFTYSSNHSDQIIHLTGITNNFGTSENYTFSFNDGQALYSPFTNTTACGSTNTNCGSASFLSSVTRTGVNLSTSFTTDGYGELQQVTFPYGGHIRWNYRTFCYLGGRYMTEANARYLQKDTTAPETTYNFYRDDNGDASRPIHAWFVVQDASGLPGKSWLFWWDASSIPAWMVGLVGNQDSRNLFYAGPGAHYDSFIWSQDAAGNPYISHQDTYLDMGTANERHSYTTTTLDSHGYGNVVSSQVYDYPLPGSNTPNLLRTTTMTYLHDSNSAYDTAYIRNRVLARTVTPASGSATVTTNTYDQYPNLYPYNGLTNDAPNLQQHDSTMDTSYKTRGNVTNVAVTVNGLNVTSTNTDYDIQGNAIATSDSLGHYNTITVDSYGNVPQSALPNGNGNLSTSFSFNSFFAPTSVSQPSNGTTASATYDTYGRPSTTTSPGGAVTKYYYCPMVTSDNDSCDKVGFTLPATRTGLNYTRITVVNSRWSRDQYDGLGRVIRTDRGDTSGNVVSMVDTDYDSCACSPTGKMKQTSLPYKPGAAVYWTVYTYDGLGRTLSVRAPDGASTTSYAYYGNTTVVTDPAQKWKAMTSDVNGNLTSVIEPDPSQGTVSAPGSVQSPNCGSAPLTGSTQLTGLPAQTLGTCYYYDAFNNLTGVDLYRSNYNQVRTFTYQPGTNWLLTATNPENGKVTYTRDSAGRVLTRVDAAQQTTSYTYDAYNRLTKVDRGSNACGTDNYYYDQPIPGRNDGFSSGYSWGKLTAVSFGNASGGACPGSDPVNSTTWGGVVYEYAYSQAGQVTGKRMAVTRGYQSTNYTANLDTYWNYDGEGRVIQLTYPSHIDSYTGNPVTTTYQYSYDALGRPQNLNNVTPQPDQIAIQASVSQYNENDQILSWSYGSNWNYWGFQGGAITEARQYNQMFQLTGIAATWENNNGTQQAFSENYIYSGNQNNGQITDVCTNGIWNQQTSTCSGEKVHYQNDQLKRLTGANSTVGWSQTYNYDGFGNMTWKNPGFNVLMDVSTNRMTGFSYDSNGNLALGNWSYDAENRLVRVDSGGGEYYAYDPSNKRVYRQNENNGGGGDTYYLYGVDGKKLGEYTAGIGCAPGYNNWPCPYVLSMTVVGESVYFAGKKVGSYQPHDRLGSVRGNASGANRQYGENYTGGGDGFATYYQDSSTGLDYADQRYYSATYGRFNTPDRYKASVGAATDPSDPQSWNRYAYVGNDPMNFGDSHGTEKDLIDDDPPDVYSGDSDWCTGDLSGAPDPSCSEEQSTGTPRMSGPCPSGYLAYNYDCFLHAGTRSGANWTMFLGALQATINSIITKDSDCLNFLESGDLPGGKQQAYQRIGNAQDAFSIADDMRLQSSPNCWYCLRGVAGPSSTTGKPMINFNTFANESMYQQREDIIHELAHYTTAIPSETVYRTSAMNNKPIDDHCAKTLNAQ